MKPNEKTFIAFLKTIIHSPTLWPVVELLGWIGLTFTAIWLYSPSDLAPKPNETYNAWWIFIVGLSWAILRMAYWIWKDWDL